MKKRTVHLAKFFAKVNPKFRLIKRKMTNPAYFSRKKIDSVGMKLEEWIKKGRHRENYDSMDEILEELDITRDELSFFCSSRLHKRFLTWRKELRIQEAKDLILEKTDVPISQIAFYVGISDKSDFRHQFKSIVGCTPSEWRFSQGKMNEKME